MFSDIAPISAILLRWIKSQLSSYEFLTNIENAAECFTNGQVFCCLINRYVSSYFFFVSYEILKKKK